MTIRALPTPRALASLLLGCALLSPSAAVAGATPLLAHDGSVARLLAGTAEGLGVGGDGDGDHRVLVLETVDADGLVTRTKVPSTGGVEREIPVRLFAERDRDGLDLLWWKGSELWTVARSSDGWGEATAVHADPRGIQPVLEITSDTWEIPTEDGAVTLERSILHLAWWDPDVGALLYRPFTVGAESAPAPIPLTEVFDFDSPAPPTGLPDSLSRAFDVRRSATGRQIVVTKVEALAGSFDAIRVQVLPSEVVHLGGHVHDEVLAAADDLDGGSTASFLERIGIEIIGMGARFGYPDVLLEWISGELGVFLEETLATQGPEGLASAAAERVEALLEDVFGQDVPLAHSEVPLRDIYLGDPVHDPILRLTRVRSWDLPPDLFLGAEVPSGILGTESGRELALLWLDEATDGLHWMTASPSGWSEARRLQLGESLTLAQSVDAVRSRLR